MGSLNRPGLALAVTAGATHAGAVVGLGSLPSVQASVRVGSTSSDLNVGLPKLSNTSLSLPALLRSVTTQPLGTVSEALRSLVHVRLGLGVNLSRPGVSISVGATVPTPRTPPGKVTAKLPVSTLPITPTTPAILPVPGSSHGIRAVTVEQPFQQAAGRTSPHRNASQPSVSEVMRAGDGAASSPRGSNGAASPVEQVLLPRQMGASAQPGDAGGAAAAHVATPVISLRLIAPARHDVPRPEPTRSAPGTPAGAPAPAAGSGSGGLLLASVVVGQPAAFPGQSGYVSINTQTNSSRPGARPGTRPD